VNKEVTGAGAPELAQGPFTFSVVCEFNGKAAVVDESITIPKGTTGQSAFTSEKLEGLPAGASCVVSETDNGGADDTPAPVTVVVPDSDNVVAGFTGEHANVYSAGTIDVTKTLAGDAADEDYAKNAVFTILVTCERDAKDAEGNPVRTTVFSQSVDIKGGESSGALLGADGKAVKLPLGTSCYGVETKTGGATAGSVNHDSFENGAKVVPSEVPTDLQQLTITATNTFSYGELTLSKKLDGAAAGYVGGREFTLALSCELEQGGATATPIIADKPFTLKGGETVAVDKLPVGANCWVAETDNGGASTVAIDHGDRANAAVVGQDRAVALTVTNTFDAGLLTVSKKVVNGGAGPYTFTLVCTTGQGAVALAPGDAAFTLKGGAAKTISVPNGAACVVAESNVPDGDTVTYLASSGAKDGNVRVNGTATLQVTNTFKVAPVTPLTPATPATPLDPGTGPELGNTGAAGIGGLTLAALGALLAGMVLVVRRRKAAQG
jgi:LPXTG-motif cell wall-anchored protein